MKQVWSAHSAMDRARTTQCLTVFIALVPCCSQFRLRSLNLTNTDQLLKIATSFWTYSLRGSGPAVHTLQPRQVQLAKATHMLNTLGQAGTTALLISWSSDCSERQYCWSSQEKPARNTPGMCWHCHMCSNQLPGTQIALTWDGADQSGQFGLTSGDHGIHRTTTPRWLNSAEMLRLDVQSRSLIRSLGQFEGCKYEKGSGEQLSNEFFSRHAKLEERLGAFVRRQPKTGAHFQRKGFNISCWLQWQTTAAN